MTLKAIVEDTDTRAGRAWDLAVQALILISLVSFSIETLPKLRQETRFWLYVVEVVTVALFTLEYALRILVADKRLGFIFSFYGLVDLLAILPFYISAGVDLRAVRIVRLFRVFRLFKFLRYTEALQRFRDAFREIKEELALYLISTALLVYLSSVGIYYFESEAQPDQFASVFHCLWWSVVTLTTVGYGDVYPVTIGGKIFTAFVLIAGIGIIAVPTGLLASALTRARTSKP
ncbi:MAG: voltage-gated potassium channel [Planctomycetes bacterium RBG_16_64_12]|nr:MAG: voltage-gated potassium channel [Planctomycetes bacterium RBG_16_64_12]